MTTLPSLQASTAAVNRPLAGYRFVQIQQGDTLHDIAVRELGDASKWSDLIAINNLNFPYLTGDPTQAGPNVLLYGNLIVVPAAVAQVQATADPSAVYGTDLLLQNGLLVANNGDFATVSGLPNLIQALTNRMATGLRELMFHLAYGNGARGLLGKVNGPTAILLAAQYVKAALQQETRLSSVNSAVGVAQGDQVIVDANVTPVAGASVNISTTV